MRKKLALLLVIMVALVFVGCGNRTNEELVGTWTWGHSSDWEYVFKEDGTGTRPGLIEEATPFTWSINGDILTIDSEEDSFIEEWLFEIVDDVLILTSNQVEGMVFEYTRVQW